jgi:peptidoglycan hydrolase CwlO-like protein
MPADGTCKHCRQPLSEEHRQACQNEIDQSIQFIKDKSVSLQQQYTELGVIHKSTETQLKELERQHTSFNDLTIKLSTHDKEIADKKSLHTEYTTLLDAFNKDLTEKTVELEQVQIEIANSSLQDQGIEGQDHC